MILDRTKVYLRSGSGGEGDSTLRSISSRKLKAYGGDGGKGGDVILKISPHLYDLSKFKGSKKFIASDGTRGGANNKKGQNADNLIVFVPEGTRVICQDKVIADLNGSEKEFLICRGGFGGKGNYKRNYTVAPGLGEEKEAEFDYRIPNEVALIGLANTGKSSLFNALTGQNQKIADYPFTTRSCFWAESEYNFKGFRVLDTPPVKIKKEGSPAQENDFLRHLFRSRVVLIVGDEVKNWKKDFEAVKEEVSLYDAEISKGKKFFYLLNKIDKIDTNLIPEGILTVSAKSLKGLDILKKKIIECLC
ncbi:MAG: 50S ribosome-binding GTPase [Candidatus Omnitrophica bacterium]|nr:50S ribosome-binding GTPase [Candidatus Omnitrophota bacterium]MDD5430072.1 50S ribosome-binding GTPase [Candidatus Omnitrophota bacterium]